jgi:WD40 repeat protein
LPTLSPDGTRLVALAATTATEWQTASGRKIRAFTVPPSTVPRSHRSFGRRRASRVYLSSDGREIVAVPNDSAYVYGPTRQLIARLGGRDDRVSAITTSADGEVALVTRSSGAAAVFNLVTQREIRLHARGDFIVAKGVSADGTRVLTESSDGKGAWATVWNGYTGAPIARFKPAAVAAISPDGRLLVTTTSLGSIRVWDATNSKHPVARLDKHVRAETVAFSSDAKRVVVAGFGFARIWEIRKKKSIDLHLPAADINSVAFSRDGRFVLTAGEDTPTRIWETAHGRQVAVLAHESVEAATFLPDGKHVATIGDDEVLRVYECQVCVPPDDLLALARARS